MEYPNLFVLLLALCFYSTLSAKLPGRPREFQLTLIQDSPPIVSLTWKSPRNHVEGYGLVYWIRPERDITEQRFNAETLQFTTEFLEYGAEYEFRLFAKNSEGYGFPAAASIRTPEGIPTAAQTNFTAIGISSSRVKLQWDPPSKRYRNGQIVLYEVLYYNLPHPNYFSANTTENVLMIDGLQSSTDYFFQVRAYTNKGPGPWSNRLAFRTFRNSAGTREVNCFIGPREMRRACPVEHFPVLNRVEHSRSMQEGAEIFRTSTPEDICKSYLGYMNCELRERNKLPTRCQGLSSNNQVRSVVGLGEDVCNEDLVNDRPKVVALQQCATDMKVLGNADSCFYYHAGRREPCSLDNLIECLKQVAKESGVCSEEAIEYGAALGRRVNDIHRIC